MAKATARGGSRQKRRRTRRRGSLRLPRGFAMGVVLLVFTGLVAWYFRAALDTVPGESPLATPKPANDTSQTKPKSPDADATDRFEFYDMLPDAEVDVAEPPKASDPSGPPPVSVPGTYVVQAGAFPQFAQADKVKARLALLGVVSEIQTAQANGALFHRVRIGPLDNLEELNQLRARLQRNGIEYQVIPVGE